MVERRHLENQDAKEAASLHLSGHEFGSPDLDFDCPVVRDDVVRCYGYGKNAESYSTGCRGGKIGYAVLRNIAYDEIDAKGPHERRAIEGMDDGSWESSVTVAPEKTLSDGERTKVKMATIQIFRTGDTVSRFSLDVPLVSSDFNVKNDDEKHRISEKYDEKHKTVDTVINRKVIYDNIKNDTPSHRISMVWDEASQSIKTLVDGKEIDGGGQKGWPDWENARVLEPTQHEKHINYGYFLMPDDGFFIYVPSSYTSTEKGTMYVLPHGKEIYSGECADWNDGAYRKNPACGFPKGFHAGYAFPVSKGTFAWYHGQGYGVFVPLKK